jgi:hypothetical protein
LFIAGCPSGNSFFVSGDARRNCALPSTRHTVVDNPTAGKLEHDIAGLEEFDLFHDVCEAQTGPGQRMLLSSVNTDIGSNCIGRWRGASNVPEVGNWRHHLHPRARILDAFRHSHVGPSVRIRLRSVAAAARSDPLSAAGPIGKPAEPRRWMIRAEPRATWTVELFGSVPTA